MVEIQNPKRYDLEDRTLLFFRKIIALCRKIKQDAVNVELIRQLIRSSGSIGANYREANQAISKKDLNLRIRISRKEAKESHFWLQSLGEANPHLVQELEPLAQESIELARILTAIMNKTK